jgi:hypothetical protein
MKLLFQGLAVGASLLISRCELFASKIAAHLLCRFASPSLDLHLSGFDRQCASAWSASAAYGPGREQEFGAIVSQTT